MGHIVHPIFTNFFTQLPHDILSNIVSWIMNFIFIKKLLLSEHSYVREKSKISRFFQFFQFEQENSVKSNSTNFCEDQMNGVTQVSIWRKFDKFHPVSSGIDGYHSKCKSNFFPKIFMLYAFRKHIVLMCLHWDKI